MQVLAESQQVAELREEALIRELFGKTYKTGPILVLWPKRRLTCCIQLSLNVAACTGVGPAPASLASRANASTRPR